MRPILAGDVFAAARAVQDLPEPEQARWVHQLLEQADWADKYRKRTAKHHPRWGNGSVMGVIGCRDAPKGSPRFADPEFCTAARIVLQELADWRAFKARRGGRKTHDFARN